MNDVKKRDCYGFLLFDLADNKLNIRRPEYFKKSALSNIVGDLVAFPNDDFFTVHDEEDVKEIIVNVTPKIHEWLGHSNWFAIISTPTEEASVLSLIADNANDTLKLKLFKLANAFALISSKEEDDEYARAILKDELQFPINFI